MNNYFIRTVIKESSNFFSHNNPPKAWAEDQGIAGSFVTMFGDPTGEVTDALDMKMKYPAGPAGVGILGRCKRYAMIVDDGAVKFIAEAENSEDPAGDDDPSSTLAPALLEAVKGL